MLDACDFETGRVCLFDYPRHNLHGVVSTCKRRRIQVTGVRDLMLNPLDPETAELQPLLRRCQWLITGIDLDKSAERSFYLESMSRIEWVDHEVLVA